MNFGVYGILIIFGAFIILLLTNPKLSCFGKRLKSPFYPLLRRKRMEREAKARAAERAKTLPTEDYGFKLEDAAAKPAAPGAPPAGPGTKPGTKPGKKGEDYDFKLD